MDDELYDLEMTESRQDFYMEYLILEYMRWVERKHPEWLTPQKKEDSKTTTNQPAISPKPKKFKMRTKTH